MGPTDGRKDKQMRKQNGSLILHTPLPLFVVCFGVKLESDAENEDDGDEDDDKDVDNDDEGDDDDDDKFCGPS